MHLGTPKTLGWGAAAAVGTLGLFTQPQGEGLDLMMSKSLLETSGSFITRLRRA